MGDFTPITTQEQLDQVIKDRITRERETVEKRYEGYVSRADFDKALADTRKQLEEAATQHAGDTKTIEELTGKVRTYETDSVKTRIAHEMGLPYGMASRLTGEDEKSIRADAEVLKSMIGKTAPEAPPAVTEPSTATGAARKKAAYKALLNSINSKE